MAVPDISHAPPDGSPQPMRQSRTCASRRPPSVLSKALPNCKRQKIAHNTGNVNTKAATSPVARRRHQTNESASDVSASKWFDQANRNVWQSIDIDGPEASFHLDQSDLHLPDASNHGNDQLFGAQHCHDTEKEELREVIDDLTLENRKLKMLLKQSQTKSSPSSSAPDRLLEVKILRLSVPKKRELEQLLKNFAAGISKPSGPVDSTRSSRNLALLDDRPAPAKRMPADSGYGTMSSSALASSNGNATRQRTSDSSRSRPVKHHLHDFPDVFPSHQSPLVKQQAKEALVVRRLEILFTGQHAAPGIHSQSVQQQEIAHSAERPDAKAQRLEKREGTREAHVLHPDTRVNLDAVDQPGSPPPSKIATPCHERAAQVPSEASKARPSSTPSPEQRPTRPLDIDIQRAQVASDNVNYLRHLGVDAPWLVTGRHAEDQSWIYLNLLIGMAQLHTLNVTHAFVRRAVRNHSTKFQLSTDGHKVRWMGGDNGTPLSVPEEHALDDIEQSLLHPVEHTASGGSSRAKTDNSSNVTLSEEPSTSARSGPPSGLEDSNPANDLSTPAQSRALLSTNGLQSTSNPRYSHLVCIDKNHSNLGSTNSYRKISNVFDDPRYLSDRVGSVRGDRCEEGTVTFYQNSHYFCDVSGDGATATSKLPEPVDLRKVLGINSATLDKSALIDAPTRYFTKTPEPETHQPNSLGFLSGFSEDDIRFSGQWETTPVEMDASGIGGVVLADNFAIDVKIDRKRNQQCDQVQQHPLLTMAPTIKRYSYQMLDAATFELRPSMLPPPGHMMWSSTSSSDPTGEDNSDSESASSSEIPDSLPADSFYYCTNDSEVGIESSALGESSAAPIIQDTQIASTHGVSRPQSSIAVTIGGSLNTPSPTEMGLDSDEDGNAHETGMYEL